MRIVLFSLLLFACGAQAQPKAVATFESIGIHWKVAADPGAAGCAVQYRRQGERPWRNGLALWFDTRDRECRGSLVNLQPGTAYEIQVEDEKPIRVSTWRENFPRGRTVTLPAGVSNETLFIREGGSPQGYVVYQGHASGTTLDAEDAQPHNVVIAAPYVIVRGLFLKGAQRDAIDVRPGAHDVVIEDNDISGWGRYRYTNSKGWKIGVDMDSGVRANCTKAKESISRVVIQRNRIHDPRYGANSWSWGHPAGPQGITFSHCGGNHVIRHNEVTSADPQRYFNDGIGGEDNFSGIGFPSRDTDIHGNVVQGAWDDAIEAEGGNRNVRIWGNYLDQVATGVASTVVHHGPLYVFRNVYNRSRKLSERAPDADDRGPFAKSGSVGEYGGGRRYVFHNTLLQAPAPGGASLPLGAGTGLQGQTKQPLTNTVSRNNIWHIWKPHWQSIRQTDTGSGNDVDYDLYNGAIQAGARAQDHGLRGIPVYMKGHGSESGAGGRYQLAPSSPGFDKGARIPNFNDGFAGDAPDIGAHEHGSAPMQFGVPRP